ncbi:AIPR family protein [Rosenbergiella epipactidis]|uniref:AIPR family protein n=1 Tax=Rosenbergiella epipactidis TaxID=1544694 RepID=UPI001F4F0623|nr:AIPR family protein [Rosenbergiella epipactidis]
MDAITKSLLSSFSHIHEIDKEKESVRFENFCSYSIVTNVIRSSFELESVHTGDGGDCGIDGCAIIVNGKLVFDIDEIESLRDANKYLDVDIIFIQAKTSSSFDSGFIGKFLRGVKGFISGKSKAVKNEKIKHMANLWSFIIENSHYMKNRNPSCSLYYVCTGLWCDDINLQATIDDGVDEIRKLNLLKDISFLPYGASEIVESYRKTQNKLENTVNMVQKVTLPEITGVGQAYLGILPYMEFLKLIQDDNQTIHSIFDDNIRDFQGENEVNKKIKDTVNGKGGKELFCLLNNGVTIVSSHVISSGNRLTLRDYQVVNGCQTSNVLHECRGVEGISDVYVPVKIIETEDEDVKNDITLATNSQTAVKTEQLQSLNKYQRTLELFYDSVKNKKIRLHYERRSQQYSSDLSIKRSQIITIPIQIKAFASAFLKSPHLVSGYYGTIVNRFKDEMFLDEHKPAAYYASALIYYRVENYFKSGDLNSSLRKAKFQIIMLVKIIALGLDSSPLNSQKFNVKCEALIDLLNDDAKALDLIQDAQSVFAQSDVDLGKRQYKSETDTLKLIDYVRGLNLTPLV